MKNVLVAIIIGIAIFGLFISLLPDILIDAEKENVREELLVKMGECRSLMDPPYQNRTNAEERTHQCWKEYVEPLQERLDELTKDDGAVGHE